MALQTALSFYDVPVAHLGDKPGPRANPAWIGPSKPSRLGWFSGATAITNSDANPDDAALVGTLKRATTAYGGDLVDGTDYESPAKTCIAGPSTPRPGSPNLTSRPATSTPPWPPSTTPFATIPTPKNCTGGSCACKPPSTGPTPSAGPTVLETRLADLDVEPDDTTDRLLAELLALAAGQADKQIANTRTSA